MKLVVGQKIKALRLTSDLTQEELANRAGVSKGFISQLENDQTSVQIDTLADILEALGVTLAEFFSENGQPPAVFGPSDRVDIEDTGASKFQLLVPGSTNNEMDPVLIELKPGERLEKGEPHPGEQFGYVLKGTATLYLGKERHQVGANSCFYFSSDKEHQLCNEGNQAVLLLWVVTPPQM